MASSSLGTPIPTRQRPLRLSPFFFHSLQLAIILGEAHFDRDQVQGCSEVPLIDLRAQW